ncbi:Crinkler (CRN), partial [Phytophthora megakarya]
MAKVRLLCAFVGEKGTFAVHIDEDKFLYDLQVAIKKENSNRLKDADAKTLELFPAKLGDKWLSLHGEDGKAVREGKTTEVIEELLQKSNQIPGADQLESELLKGMPTPGARQLHVLVKVADIGIKRPASDEEATIRKKKKSDKPPPKTLTEFENLTVNETEFQLDTLAVKQQSENPIIMTPGLNAFWEGFGEFPPLYFVREEEVIFWNVIKKFLSPAEKEATVIV